MTEHLALEPVAQLPEPSAPRWDRPLAPAGWPGPAGLYPLPFPELAPAGEVFVPTQGSFLVWRHLFGARVGAGRRCLDVGCGSGLQSIQLARNGATRVHGIDIDPDAVAATLANARRNGVADRVSAAPVDLLSWVPRERHDVVVASLYQMPAGPLGDAPTHRPTDFWGREAFDHLIGLLPQLLAPGGVAYVMQLSVLSRQHTDEVLAGHGLQARAVDFAFYEFTDRVRRSADQIARVERVSDAHHLSVAGHEVMVAYLLEITRCEG